MPRPVNPLEVGRKWNVLARYVVAALLLLVIAVVTFQAFVWPYPWALVTPFEPVWQQECSRLYGAMESFREKFDETPPNFDDMDRVARFVERVFPEYKPGVSAPYPRDLDAAEALVFWLGGISTEPADPFAPEAKERHKFYEFRPSGLHDGRYYPRGIDDTQPFVYFTHTSYATEEYEGFRPYVRSQRGREKEYCAPETAQIIAPGRDGKLGRGGLITKLSEEDRDNVVSFDTRRVGDIGVEE